MPSQPSPGKKSVHPLVWIGGGCGIVALILVLLLFIGGMMLSRKASEFIAEFEQDPERASAELIVRMNPDLELVETLEEEGKMTVRVRSEDKTVTVSYGQLQDGVFTVESEDGEFFTMDLGQEDFDLETLPAEMRELVYPGATAQGGSFQAETHEGRSQLVNLQTDDDFDTVVEFYEQKFEEFRSRESQVFSFGDQKTGKFSGRQGNMEVSVAIRAETDGSTRIHLTGQFSTAP